MAESIYEKYLQTDLLLSCQKPATELINHDERLFQTVHQVSELWMKQIRHELDEVTRILLDEEERLWRAVHLLRRVRETLAFLGAHLSLLETMHPADYMPIRATLGDGSGMDSPGFRAIREAGPPLAAAFGDLLDRRPITALELHRQPERDYAAYQVMQGLLELDEGFQKFRHSHVMLAMRQIGASLGTGGTQMPVLLKRAQQSFFPALWEAIAQLSEENRVQY